MHFHQSSIKPDVWYNSPLYADQEARWPRIQVPSITQEKGLHHSGKRETSRNYGTHSRLRNLQWVILPGRGAAFFVR